ncbi:MAG: AmmeMemoRadiSam system protein B [Planctomycetes bacterium]|nr:AmmeMemoRadiSam system protein B [Planctomycetota bacterium]
MARKRKTEDPDPGPGKQDPPAPPSKPRLRPLQIQAFREGEEMLLLLEDPFKFTPPVSMKANPLVLLVLTSLDGEHDARDIQAGILKQTGQMVPADIILDVIGQLDEHLLLDSPTFTRARDRIVADFRAAPTRPACHAGGAYEKDPEKLRAQLDALFVHKDGPGAVRDGTRRDDLVGLVSPHIDLHRGGPCYAWAYKELAERSTAELYVIFGTCHAPTPGLFAMTRKAFDTPLGVVPTDQEFIDRVVARYPRADLFAGEFAHQAEHSIEFQALFLQYLFGGKRPFAAVPILVTSFHEYVADGQEPAQAADVAEFVTAVREAAAASGKRVCYVCGADLAHMGSLFQDRIQVTPSFLKDLEKDDLAMLRTVEACDTDGFFRSIADDKDRRKVCGFPPLYTMMAVLGQAKGKLLRYSQWADLGEVNSTVTFASVSFERQPA